MTIRLLSDNDAQENAQKYDKSIPNVTIELIFGQHRCHVLITMFIKKSIRQYHSAPLVYCDHGHQV